MSSDKGNEKFYDPRGEANYMSSAPEIDQFSQVKTAAWSDSSTFPTDKTFNCQVGER